MLPTVETWEGLSPAEILNRFNAAIIRFYMNVEWDAQFAKGGPPMNANALSMALPLGRTIMPSGISTLPLPGERPKCSCGNYSVCDCGKCSLHCRHPEDPHAATLLSLSASFSIITNRGRVEYKEPPRRRGRPINEGWS